MTAAVPHLTVFLSPSQAEEGNIEYKVSKSIVFILVFFKENYRSYVTEQFRDVSHLRLLRHDSIVVFIGIKLVR